MKSKKKRDKKYQPRPRSENHQFGGLVAIGAAYARGENAAPLREDQTADLGVAYWLAFENLRVGSASEESWSIVSCALNVALVLAERGIGPEHEADLVLALDGAFRAKMRSETSSTFRLDGDALRDIEHALQVHDAQMQIATRAEVSQAMEAIYKRMEAGNVYQATPYEAAQVEK